MQGKIFSVEIRPQLPERFQRLEALANDLYFSWNRGMRGFFRHLDEEAWHESGHNPKVFLRRVSQRKLDAAARDPILFAEYRRVLSVYDTYMEERPHTRIADYLDPERDLVAYFSAEFGFHQSMPIYAGGLGILAADYCKAMSNLWVPFVGVGLLYHQGYFTQRILAGGEQQASYPYNDAEDLPVSLTKHASGEELQVEVELAGRIIKLRVWTAIAGHIRLYLLDSDHPDNAPADRAITAQLYGGDTTNRIRQEIVLGIGGVRVLRALGLEPSVWHINEGHAAFQILERCGEYCRQGYDFDAALERVASCTVFTTHTPVPAGHDIFDQSLALEYFRPLLPQLGIDEVRFLGLGRHQHGGFNMTALALRGSRFHNGVSRLHGQVASRMEAYIWPEILPEENPMGHVTNGVDVETFLGSAWVSVFDMYCGAGWRAKLTDKKFWRELIDHIPDHVFCSAHHVQKAELLEYARQRLEVQFQRIGLNDSAIAHITRFLNPQSLETLVVGFARRFATYKRATLLFSDLDRLARLVNSPEQPVLLLFAGKAHPNDQPGQELIKEVYRVSMLPEFQGRILLLEDYNLSMARELMPGVDVWLNVPEFPKEACGTSGMKAGLNGALNLSVLDGWWAEAFDQEQNGWAIQSHPELELSTRNSREARELLDILEYKVIPLYYLRDGSAVRTAWLHKSKAAMKSILPMYNGIRMALDYLRGYYHPALAQGRRLGGEDGRGAKELAGWKQKVSRAWPKIKLRLLSAPPTQVRIHDPIPVEVGVELNGLGPADVVVECVFGRINELGQFQVQCIVEGSGAAHADCSLRLDTDGEVRDGFTRYRLDLAATDLQTRMVGLVHFKLRVYPYNPLQAHRFELGLMKWLDEPAAS
jgi:starch phosphorylase